MSRELRSAPPVVDVPGERGSSAVFTGEPAHRGFVVAACRSRRASATTIISPRLKMEATSRSGRWLRSSCASLQQRRGFVVAGETEEVAPRVRAARRPASGRPAPAQAADHGRAEYLTPPAHRVPSAAPSWPAPPHQWSRWPAPEMACSGGATHRHSPHRPSPTPDQERKPPLAKPSLPPLVAVPAGRAACERGSGRPRAGTTARAGRARLYWTCVWRRRAGQGGPHPSDGEQAAAGR